MIHLNHTIRNLAYFAEGGKSVEYHRNLIPYYERAK